MTRKIHTGYWYVPKPESTRGGQHVGTPRGVLVYDETLQLGVLSFSERSQFKSIADANALLDLAAEASPGRVHIGPAQRIGAIVDALPIDLEADAVVSKMMRERTAGYKSRKLVPALTAEERDVLAHARQMIEVNTKACRTQATARALTVLDRLLGV